MSTPRSMRPRASWENLTSLAARGWAAGEEAGRETDRRPERGRAPLPGLRGSAYGRRPLDDAEDVAHLHHEQFLAVDLDLGAGPLAEQHLVALFDLERDVLALLVAGAGSYGDHLALHGLLFGGVGYDDAARGL